MRVAYVLGVSLLSIAVLSGCQSLPPAEEVIVSGPQRLQGELDRSGGNLLLRPCQGGAPLQVSAEDSLGLPAAVAQLQQEHPGALFADVHGNVHSAAKRQTQRLLVDRLYRLQPGGARGCQDERFATLIARASGNAPSWTVSISAQGMVLERAGMPREALPYLQERLPDGSMSFSSEANGHRVELWLSPERCSDSRNGALSHLQASLLLDDQKALPGCAALGGAGE